MFTYAHRQHPAPLLFGKAEPEAQRREWREAIHESRNVRRYHRDREEAKKISEDALRVAQCTIKLLERSRSGNEKNCQKHQHLADHHVRDGCLHPDSAPCPAAVPRLRSLDATA
jgi:hypothetical protein